MLPLNLSESDKARLNFLKCQRIAELLNLKEDEAIVEIAEGALFVHCAADATIDLLMHRNVAEVAYAVAGLEEVMIGLLEDFVAELGATRLDTIMPTLQAPETVVLPSATTRKSTPRNQIEALYSVTRLAEVLSDRTGKSVAEVLSEIESLSPEMFEAGGERFIRLSVVDPFMQRWAASIAADIETALKAPQKGVVTTRKPAAKKTASPRTTKTKRTPAKKPAN